MNFPIPFPHQFITDLHVNFFSVKNERHTGASRRVNPFFSLRTKKVSKLLNQNKTKDSAPNVQKWPYDKKF